MGGGDCGLAAEVLKHKSIRNLVQVESILRSSGLRERTSEGSMLRCSATAAFGCASAMAPILSPRPMSALDLVLVDSTDPGGVSLPLFTETFYRNARGCLKPGGLLIAQLGAPFLQAARVSRPPCSGSPDVFPRVSCYLVPIPMPFRRPARICWASSVSECPDSPRTRMSWRALHGLAHRDSLLHTGSPPRLLCAASIHRGRGGCGDQTP